MKPARNKYEIVYDILTLLKNIGIHTSESAFLSKSNLVYGRFKELKAELITCGLVEVTNAKRVGIAVTPKGYEYCERFVILQEMFKHD